MKRMLHTNSGIRACKQSLGTCSNREAALPSADPLSAVPHLLLLYILFLFSLPSTSIRPKLKWPVKTEKKH
ncbi:hypothetical protein FKM82_008018 [Ascaphus truei]